jgi:Bacterial Ig-like domain (group 3)
MGSGDGLRCSSWWPALGSAWGRSDCPRPASRVVRLAATQLMCTAIGLFCFVSQAAAGIKTATTTKLSLSSTSIVYGNEESATFSSEVTADAGTPTGEVEFKAGKTKVCIGTLTNGLTNCSPSKQTLLKIGTYPVVAEYKGAKTYAKSTSGATDLTVEAEGSAPVATITKAPSGEVPSGQVEVDFSSSQADSSFECSLDGSTYASCSSPDVFTVAAGRHTFSVVAVNSTGVRSKAPATASWTAIGTAAVLDVCGKVAGNETWSPEIAKVYVLTCEAEVPAGAILSISAGTIIKADSGTGLEVNGVLSAAGTSSSPVTFTSINDDSVGGDTNGNPESTPSAGEWRGISINTGFGAVNPPTVNLAETTLRYAQTAISASGEANVTVHGTIDDDNFGVSASTRSPVNATDVYWGSSSGPAPYGSGVGVSEGVLVTPWLTS